MSPKPTAPDPDQGNEMHRAAAARLAYLLAVSHVPGDRTCSTGEVARLIDTGGAGTRISEAYVSKLFYGELEPAAVQEEQDDSGGDES